MASGFGVLGRAAAGLEWLRNGPRLLGVGLFLILADFVILGPFSFYQEHDNGDAIYPTVAPLADLLPRPGYFYHFGMAGTDRLATGHHGGLELFLYWLLPDWLGLTLLTIILAVLPAVFVYRLARDCFQATPVMAALSGILSASTVGEGQLFGFTMALVPATIWLLMRIDRGVGNRNWNYAGLLFLVLFHGVAGFIHFMSVVVAPAVFLWFAMVYPTRRASTWFAAAIAVVIPLLMRWQDIAAAALNGGLSHRADQPRDTIPENLDVIIGQLTKPAMIPAFVSLVAGVALLGWFLSKRKTSGPQPDWGIAAPIIRLWICCAVLQSSLVVIPYLKPAFVLVLPLLDGFQLSRVGFAAPMFWSVLLAACSRLHASPVRDTRTALPEGERGNDSPVLRKGAISLVALFLAVTLVQQKIQHAEAYARTGSFVLAFGSETIADLAKRISAEGEPWRAEPIRVEATRLQAYGIETLGGYFTLYPKRYHDFWLRLIAPLERTSPSAYASMRDTGSESFLFSNEYDAHPALSDFANPDLLSLANVRYLLSKNPLREEFLVPIRQRDRPWDSLSEFGKLLENLKSNFTGFNEFYLYENPNAVRRFFRPASLEFLPDGNAVLRSLETRSLDDLLAAAPVVEGTFGSVPNATEGRVNLDRSVGHIVRQTDAYLVDVDFEADGILAGSVSYSPYWRATFTPVNGDPSELAVAPIYHAFIGALVPQGKGTVRFFYDPPYRW